MKIILALFVGALTVFLFQPVHAQSGPITAPPDSAPATAAPAPPPPAQNFASSAAQAVDEAKDGVDPGLRDRVVSVYGVGTPAAITKWWVIFYDPSVPSHGRAVKVENGQIVRAYEAKGGVVYMKELTFPRTRVSGEGAALADAQNYAAQHAIAYDGVRALLRLTGSRQELRWRVELLDNTENKGFVFTNATDGTFAMYAPPGTEPSGSGAGTGGGLVGDAKKFGNDVKSTFLGIGGDLQQFFTGERTVDQ
jgi:hypothetical protein